jgi:hypothetical protein
MKVNTIKFQFIIHMCSPYRLLIRATSKTNYKFHLMGTYSLSCICSTVYADPYATFVFVSVFMKYSCTYFSYVLERSHQDTAYEINNRFWEELKPTFLPL